MSSCRGEPDGSPPARPIPIARLPALFQCTSYLGPPPPPPANLSKLRTDLISELGQPCQPGQSQTQEEQITVCLENLTKNPIREGQ